MPLFLLVLGVLFACLQGCAAPLCLGRFTIDSAFTAEERTAIEEAFVRLNDFLTERRPPHLSPRTMVKSVPKGESFCAIVRQDIPQIATGGAWYQDEQRLGVEAEEIAKTYASHGPGVASRVLQSVIMHEVLHTMGVNHHTGAGLMSVGGHGMEITVDDRKLCIDSGLCYP